MTGSGNWTYFIDGAVPALVDAGVGRSEHLDAVAAERAHGPDVVLVTHAHPDHASGAPAIGARWPAARFAKRPWPERDARHDVRWDALSDGDRIPAGDDELIVVHTPGHSPDHVAFFHEATRTMFTGDLIVLGSSVVIQASGGGNLADYLRSLERVRAYEPLRLLPAHGPVIDDPASAVQQYLDHRRQREEQVLSALAAGAVRPGDIVSRIYVGLDSALVPMAHESVLAHLEKLESEGRARRQGGSWALY